MNAQDFKREMEELRRKHDEQQRAAKHVHVRRDQELLVLIATAARQSRDAGQTELQLDNRYGVLSDYVMNALVDSGCHVKPIEQESALTNNVVVDGYIITWYPEKK